MPVVKEGTFELLFNGFMHYGTVSVVSVVAIKNWGTGWKLIARILQSNSLI
jgi:hypothetical protein